jgi:sec-independent protein translocase protein TatA
MGAIGAPELIIVLLIILLIFGGTKLPKLARSLGEAQREFRQGQDEAKNAAATAPKDDTPPS